MASKKKKSDEIDNENELDELDDNFIDDTQINDERPQQVVDEPASDPIEEPLFDLKDEEPILPETSTVGNSIDFFRKNFAAIYKDQHKIKEHLNRQHAIKQYKKVYKNIKDILIDDDYEAEQDKAAVLWGSKSHRKNILAFAKKVAEQNSASVASKKLLQFSTRSWSRYDAKEFKAQLVSLMPTLQHAIAKLYK